MNEAYIVDAVRTPIGKLGGALAPLTAAELGAHVVRALLGRAKVAPEDVEEIFLGTARQAGGGSDPARQILRSAGIPKDAPAHTVNMACASGLKAVALAAASVRRGEARCVVAGGAESMSSVPPEPEARGDRRPGRQTLPEGFSCPIPDMDMGETVEAIGKSREVSREASDAYAARSQRLCEAARKAGRFRDEIAPIEVAAKTTRVEADEYPRDGVTLESLLKLKPVFAEDGLITAGSASGSADGAAAVLVADKAFLKEKDLEPLARIVDWTQVDVQPAMIGIGPVPATRLLLDQQKLELDDIGLIELNETFACHVLTCLREITIDPERLNVLGGGVALGHPIGGAGVRIMTTLLHEMKRRRARRGLATLCASGGLAMAMLVERP
ncbi:MAG: thiolase family protein [Acidobacteriota bacterium]|nr:MAG: thiolase family protein [Acidobacteriota bacterium]